MLSINLMNLNVMIDSNLAEKSGWDEVWDIKQSLEKTISLKFLNHFFEKTKLKLKSRF